MRTGIFGLLREYFKFRMCCLPKRGFGIHSPFVFRAYTKIIEPDRREPDFLPIENYRDELKKSGLTIIRKSVNGRVCSNLHGEEISLKQIALSTSVPAYLGRLLYRFSRNFELSNVVELGTSVGISTLYLAAGNKNRPIYTIDGELSVQNIAVNRFWQFGYKQITAINGDFDEELPKLLENIPKVGLVFIDGNHNGNALVRYVNMLLLKTDENSIIVIDDIRWSSDMEVAWKTACHDKRVSLSFDLFRCGVLFFRKGIMKQHFNLRFGIY